MTTKVIPLLVLLSALGVAACQEEGGEEAAETEETEQSEGEATED